MNCDAGLDVRKNFLISTSKEGVGKKRISSVERWCRVLEVFHYGGEFRPPKSFPGGGWSGGTKKKPGERLTAKTNLGGKDINTQHGCLNWGGKPSKEEVGGVMG